MASNTQQFGVRGWSLDNTTLVHQLKCVAFVFLQNIQLMHAPNCKKLNQIFTFFGGFGEVDNYKQHLDLQTHIGQLATIVNQLQLNGSKQIHSQTIVNLKGHMSVITLRSGKELPQ
ncbi:hypothetical protein CR513_36952, partial [Mucuna pruriens]